MNSLRAARVAAAMSAAILCAAAALVAQSDDPRRPNPYINKYVSMTQLSTVSGAPYSLEREVRSKYKMNGDQPEHVMYYRQYRDSRGCIREEMFQPQTASEDRSDNTLGLVLIFDATETKRYVMGHSGTNSSWTLLPNQANYVGDVHGFPAGVVGAPANSSMGKDEREIQFMTVSLGGDTMLGLHVEGIRQTGTHANGDKMYEIEGWFSPELQLPILVKSDDLHGHVERRVTKLERAEPDASLFVPPADYKIAEGIFPGKQAAGGIQ